jgi:hypothetical protein
MLSIFYIAAKLSNNDQLLFDNRLSLASHVNLQVASICYKIYSFNVNLG